MERGALTLGLDEAGRGPVLGPMVLAGVAVTSAQAAELSRAGVADSKRFGAGVAAHARRLDLAARIRAVATAVLVRVVDVAEIDRRVRLGQLNALEREHGEWILSHAPCAARIIADGARMFAPLTARFPHLEARDRAEAVHVAVAAASVVAKARRDELFLLIALRYEAAFGRFAGGGYDNPPTRAFLAEHARRHGGLPPEARQSWGAKSQARAMCPPTHTEAAGGASGLHVRPR